MMSPHPIMSQLPKTFGDEILMPLFAVDIVDASWSKSNSISSQIYGVLPNPLCETPLQ